MIVHANEVVEVNNLHVHHYLLQDTQTLQVFDQYSVTNRKQEAGEHIDRGTRKLPIALDGSMCQQLQGKEKLK